MAAYFKNAKVYKLQTRQLFIQREIPVTWSNFGGNGPKGKVTSAWVQLKCTQ